MDEDAEAEDVEPAGPPTQDQDFGASVKRFVTIFLFILALFVIFDTELRTAMGDAVGSVLAPLFAFDHRFPVFTFFPVAIVMVLATSLIRHVMMDWKEMAKVQHITSHLNKELFQATKDDNKYKVKKLNKIKESDEFAELQSKQMGSTWKVMGPTMLIAVAIFSWMFSFAAAPVAFAVDAPQESVAIAWETNLVDAFVVDGSDTVHVSQAGDLYVYGPEGETVSVTRDWDSASFQGSTLGPFDPSVGREIALEPGTYSVRSIEGETDLTAGGQTLKWPIVVVDGPDGLTVRKVRPVGTDQAPTITIASGDTVWGVVPTPVRPGQDGHVRVEFAEVGATGGEAVSKRVDLTQDDVLELGPGPTTHVVSKTGKVPWTTFNLNGTTVLPNWILLYSLFTIPFGYLFQKLFKAWEYGEQFEEHPEV